MKNLIKFLFAGLFLFVIAAIEPQEAKAQTEVSYAADTLTDADTGAFTYANRVSRNNVIAFSVTATELSGAATLTATLQGAVVSGSWDDIGSAETLINAGSPNAATHIFTVADSPYKYYRVSLSQTGTASTEVTAAFIFKAK